jgi:hypothetical protein
VLRRQDVAVWRVRAWQSDGTVTGQAFRTEADDEPDVRAPDARDHARVPAHGGL